MTYPKGVGYRTAGARAMSGRAFNAPLMGANLPALKLPRLPTLGSVARSAKAAARGGALGNLAAAAVAGWALNQLMQASRTEGGLTMPGMRHTKDCNFKGTPVGRSPNGGIACIFQGASPTNYGLNDPYTAVEVQQGTRIDHDTGGIHPASHENFLPSGAVLGMGPVAALPDYILEDPRHVGRTIGLPWFVTLTILRGFGFPKSDGAVIPPEVNPAVRQPGRTAVPAFVRPIHLVRLQDRLWQRNRAQDELSQVGPVTPRVARSIASEWGEARDRSPPWAAPTPITPGIAVPDLPGIIVQPGQGAQWLPGIGVIRPQVAAQYVDGRWVSLDPSRSLMRAGARTHERKTVQQAGQKSVWTNLASTGKKAFGEMTEFSDLVDALYEALPWQLRDNLKARSHGKDPSMGNKMQALYDNYQQIDLVKAAHNIAADNMKDAIIGGASKGIVEATGGSPLAMTLGRYGRALQAGGS